MKNAQRVQVPPAKSSTPPGKAGQTGAPLSARKQQQQLANEQQIKALTTQAGKQKAEKDRAENMKKMNDAVSKTDADMRKTRVKTAIEINKNMQGLIR